VIPPGDTVSLEYELEARRPGRFSAQVRLVVDDEGAREIHFLVRGVAAPAPD